MVSRPYKCPLCHSTFRNESGMKWHIAHRHEIPTAMDILGKDYNIKLANLQEENDFLKKQIESLKRELSQAQLDLLKGQDERLKDISKISEMNEDIRKMIVAIAVRDILIKQKLNIDMPSPFK